MSFVESKNGLQNSSTPPDMRSFVERTAEYVARHGLEYEKGLMNIEPPKDAGINFNFLRSSEDPLHGHYQQKLAEYLSKPQEDDSNTEIISPPAGLRTSIVMTACLVSKKGLEAAIEMMDCFAKKPGFSFLKSSNSYHPFFQKTLTEYRSLNQPDGSNQDGTEECVRFQPPAQFIFLPDQLEIKIPKGMRMKEFVTMLLTAQFVAWYGTSFWLKLTNKAGFEFTNETDSNFGHFSRLARQYTKVFSPPKDLGEKLNKSDAYVAAILDGFFRLLQWDGLQELEWRQGGVMSMVNWHASLEKDFANKPEEPEPNRQKFDESITLVPEDQFLALHSGSSTITVSICAGFEITMQSLSENVASLKEKIAEEIRIPAERLKLYGKTGLLEDNNKSLAHYNVAPGAHLNLSFCKALF